MQRFYDCGIDLGTTNSCLAIPDNDHGFEIIDNTADRMSVTPSAVLINGKGRMLIGQRAYNSQKVEDLAIQFKRQMGLSKMIPFASAKIEKMPEELSSEILKQLRSDAETRLNRPIENVVITVPAAFKTLQSEATNKAGKLAGLDEFRRSYRANDHRSRRLESDRVSGQRLQHPGAKKHRYFSKESCHIANDKMLERK